MGSETAQEAAASIATLMAVVMEDAVDQALGLGRLAPGSAPAHAAALGAVAEDLGTLAAALSIAVRMAIAADQDGH
jgi:hypothetical protein